MKLIENLSLSSPKDRAAKTERSNSAKAWGTLGLILLCSVITARCTAITLNQEPHIQLNGSPGDLHEPVDTTEPIQESTAPIASVEPMDPVNVIAEEAEPFVIPENIEGYRYSRVVDNTPGADSITLWQEIGVDGVNEFLQVACGVRAEGASQEKMITAFSDEMREMFRAYGVSIGDRVVKQMATGLVMTTFEPRLCS